MGGGAGAAHTSMKQVDGSTGTSVAVVVRKQQTDRPVPKQYRTERTLTQGCTHAGSDAVLVDVGHINGAGCLLLPVALNRADARVFGAH